MALHVRVRVTKMVAFSTYEHRNLFLCSSFPHPHADVLLGSPSLFVHDVLIADWLTWPLSLSSLSSSLSSLSAGWPRSPTGCEEEDGRCPCLPHCCCCICFSSSSCSRRASMSSAAHQNRKGEEGQTTSDLEHARAKKLALKSRLSPRSTGRSNNSPKNYTTQAEESEDKQSMDSPSLDSSSSSSQAFCSSSQAASCPSAPPSSSAAPPSSCPLLPSDSSPPRHAKAWARSAAR